MSVEDFASQIDLQSLHIKTEEQEDGRILYELELYFQDRDDSFAGHIMYALVKNHVVKENIYATAVRVAIENIAGNELTEKISVQQGDLLHGTEGKADIIIANIIADIIIMLLQDIPGKLKSGGIFLASGIIEERQNDVSAAASKVGLCVEAVDAKGGWVVMQMRKED